MGGNDPKTYLRAGTRSRRRGIGRTGSSRCAAAARLRRGRRSSCRPRPPSRPRTRRSDRRRSRWNRRRCCRRRRPEGRGRATTAKSAPTSWWRTPPPPPQPQPLPQPPPVDGKRDVSWATSIKWRRIGQQLPRQRSILRFFFAWLQLGHQCTNSRLVCGGADPIMALDYGLVNKPIKRRTVLAPNDWLLL